MRRILTVLLVFVLAVVTTAPVNADSRIKARIRPYRAGQDTQLQVRIRNSGRHAIFYDLKIHYGYDGGWWGGGSGPATAVYGNQYWMECNWQSGCTEWWRGSIPAKSKETIKIPLTTTQQKGNFPEAVVIVGYVNGQHVNISVDAKAR